MISVDRFRFGIHGLVGHEDVSSEFCGQFRRLNGCLGGENGEMHDHVDVYGNDFRGKAALQNIFMRCYSPRCPTCFRKGWAKREADRGEARLFEASKRFGLVEHGTISPPLSDRDRLLRMDANEFKAYWKMVEGLLQGYGVVGGVSMFHPARYNPVDGWYWSPHFHWLGFVVPSYGRCRRCSDRKCVGRNREFLLCDGFDAVVRREGEKNGFVVKVFGRRGKAWKRFMLNGKLVTVSGDKDNVHGTLLYQLSHAGLIVDSKRANVVRWFGVCSYRKLKVTVKRRKQLCPICDEEFVQVRCLSSDAARPVGSYVSIVALFDSDGNPYYIEAFASSSR